MSSFGYVYSIKDSIVEVNGLDSVTSGEVVQSSTGSPGLVLNLAKAWTGIVMFYEDGSIMSGDRIYRKFHTLKVSSDPIKAGNVLDLFGNVLNKQLNIFFGKTLFNTDTFKQLYRLVELKAPGIIVRQPVYESVFTGISGIDGMLPLGQGQRELIIGDRQTGKTAIAVDIILNQASIDLILSRSVI
jgi:F-type H+-transporting ATPase subunit alpha